MAGVPIAMQRAEHSLCFKKLSGGFTLVELLVVIGIIGLLTALLMPALGKARAAANRTACQSNIRQLGIGILMYCNANHGWFPTCAAPTGGGYIQFPDDWIYWEANRNLDDSPIAHYLGVHGDQLKNLLRCPADNFDGRKAEPGNAPGQGPYMYSYAMQDALGENDSAGHPLRTKITKWRSPSLKIVLTESLDQGPNSYPEPVWDYGVNLPVRHGTTISRGNVYDARGAVIGSNVSAFFIDGHVEGIGDDFACRYFECQPQLQ